MPILDTKIPCNEEFTFRLYFAAFEWQERGVSLCYHVQTLFRPVIQKFNFFFSREIYAYQHYGWTEHHLVHSDTI